MRIVHLSDIHLSKSNFDELKNTYCEALINDLISFHEEKKIDIIVITGDLVDKGGGSLYDIDGFEDKSIYTSPYSIFEKVFINPIIDALGFSKNNFLFVPGNHDVDESEILLKEEYDLTKSLNTDNIDDHLKRNVSFKHSKRIKAFKEFEENFHRENSNYLYSSNQSIFCYNYEGVNIGFILINDSWRCRSQKLDCDDKLLFGANQFFNGLNTLGGYGTKLNIALFHHPVDDFTESKEIERCLNISNISFYLYGHYHSNDFKKHYHGSLDSCFGIRGRASLNKINESHYSYQPGYQIVDLDLQIKGKITGIHYRKYKYDYNNFVYDTDACPSGIDKGPSDKGIDLKSELQAKKYSLDKSQFTA